MNIYIANLSYGVTDQDLKQLFEEYGDITSAKVIMDRYTGKSRGFGFVEMSDDEAAKKAIEELDRAEFDGKTINVSVAKPKTDAPKRSGGNFSRGGGERSNSGGGYGGGERRREKSW